VLRIVGIVLGGLVVLLAVLVGGIYLNAQRLQGQRFDNPVLQVTVARTPEQVERGKYLVRSTAACIGCHATNLTADPPLLDGNRVASLAPLGDFYAPNLTPGGRLKDWTDGDVVRAIREGVSKDGRGLLLMPSENYRNLADADVQAIVAYLRSQPAVNKELPPVRLGFLGSMLVGTGQVGSTRQAPVRNVAAPPPGANPAWGRYLTQTSGCTTCHGAELDGQNVPTGPPRGPNLRVVKGWSDEQFVRTVRQGLDPSGHQLSDDMPWREYSNATDDDLKALAAYLRSLP
jgi:mono/diheme cytochrome c family protein